MTPINQRLILQTGLIHLALDADHRRYEVTLITAGKNKNGWTLPVEVLAAALPKFANAACQIDHHSWFDWPSLERTAGTIETPYLEGDALRAYLRLGDTPAGELLGRIFDAWLADKEAGLPVINVGLSAVLWLSFDRIDGERVANEISMVESVDAVLHPAAGGKVERVLNSYQPSPQGADPPLPQRSNTMPKLITAPDTGDNDPPSPPPISAPPVLAPPADTPIGIEGALVAINRVAQQVESLNDRVELLVEDAADHEAERTVTGMGDPPRNLNGLTMGRDSMDQIDAAFEALMNGVRPPDDVRPLSGIRELYTLMSGDYNLTGQFYGDRVYLANVNSSTMAALVANRLNKMVVNIFHSYPHWWTPIFVEMDFSNLQDARWITLGGVGELPTVTPGAAYTELTWDDNTETAAFVKKGGYLGLTMEAIDKDDTLQLRLAPQALAQAAWLTLSKSLSAIFTQASGVGPNLADASALFTTGRGNLGTTALSHSEWVAVRIAMRKFTELHSGERLGVLTAPKFCLVPPDLEVTAIQVLATEHVPGHADFNVNPFASGDERMARLANAAERVIVIDLWTDTNNWAAVADPLLYPSLAIGYRYGRTPEIFSVTSPTAGLMFSNDVMPIKVRFFYATGPTDWRGLYKENVA